MSAGDRPFVCGADNHLCIPGVLWVREGNTHMDIRSHVTRRVALGLTAAALLAAGGVGAADAVPNQAAPMTTCTSFGTALGGHGAAAGSQYVYLRFTNRGSTTCTLGGYPLAAFQSAQHIMYGWPAAETPGLGGAGAPSVTLAPGQAVRALLQLPDYGNFPAGYCLPVKMPVLRVVLAGHTHLFSWNHTECTTRYGRTMVGAVHSA